MARRFAGVRRERPGDQIRGPIIQCGDLAIGAGGVRCHGQVQGQFPAIGVLRSGYGETRRGFFAARLSSGQTAQWVLHPDSSANGHGTGVAR